jgi:hypothetical protein
LTTTATIASIFVRDTAPCHALISCRAASIAPHVARDGRYVGAVRPPTQAATALLAAPADWAAVIAKQLRESHAKQSGRGKSKLTLAVPSAAADLGQGGGSVLVLVNPLEADTSKLQLQLFKNLLAQSRAALLVGFDPLACYLRTLRSQFGRYALFMPDSLHQDAVGVVWKPGAFRMRADGTAAKKSEKDAPAESSLGDFSALTTSGASSGPNQQLVQRILSLTQAMVEAGAGFAKTVQLQQ